MYCLLKELSFAKTRTDLAFPLKAIGNKRTKRETLMSNLNRLN